MNFTHWNTFLSLKPLAGSAHAYVYLEVPQKWVETKAGGKVESTKEAKQYAEDLKEVYPKEKLAEIQKTYTKEKLAELKNKVDDEGGAADLNSFDAKGGQQFEVDKPEYAGKGMLEILAMESPLLGVTFDNNHALRDVSYMHVSQELAAQGLDSNVVLMKTKKRKQGTKIQLEKGVVTVTQLVFGSDGKQEFETDGKPKTITGICTLFPDVFGVPAALQPKQAEVKKEEPTLNERVDAQFEGLQHRVKISYGDKYQVPEREALTVRKGIGDQYVVRLRLDKLTKGHENFKFRSKINEAAFQEVNVPVEGVDDPGQREQVARLKGIEYFLTQLPETVIEVKPIKGPDGKIPPYSGSNPDLECAVRGFHYY